MLTVLLILIVPLAFATGAVADDRVTGFAEQVMIDETFDAAPGGILSISVPDADVTVRNGARKDARIVVTLEGRDMDRAREYFNDLNFQVVREGDAIRVYTQQQRNSRKWSWHRTGEARIVVTATVPTEFNLDLKTSDGNIDLESFKGNATVKTSDGDILCANLSGGTLDLHTSDGDVKCESVEFESIGIVTSDGDLEFGSIQGNGQVRTSDGDVRVDRFHGDLALRTSDGDITVENANGREVSFRSSDGDLIVQMLSVTTADFVTSDGDISIGEASGNLKARTSSGNIEAKMRAPKDISLVTSDGDITLWLPANHAADLRLNGEHVSLPDFSVSGSVRKTSVDGSINGGGPRIDAKTSDGDVHVKRL